MRFLKNEDIAQMSIEKQSEFWLSLFQKGEKAAMFFEGFFFFILLVAFATSINFPPKIALLGWLATAGLLIAGVVLIFFLVSLQQVSFAEFVKAWSTPTWTDDIWKGILAVAIMFFAYFADKKGGGDFLNFINPYEAKITGKYEDDKRVSTNQSDIVRIQSERDKSINDISCSECGLIKSAYGVKIANQKSKLRANEWTANWKQVENAKIRNTIKALENERDSKIEGALARFEQKKDSIRVSYNARLFSLDTVVSKLKNQIDSSNVIEREKALQQELTNKHYGGGLSILTQLILLICRLMQVKIWRKAGREFTAIGEFMAVSSLFNIYFERITIEYNTWMAKMEINNSAKYAESFIKLETHSEDVISKNEFARMFIENKVNNFDDAKILYENNFKKNTQILDNQDEKVIILQIISDAQLALGYAEDLQKHVFQQIIDDCNIALSYLP